MNNSKEIIEMNMNAAVGKANLKLLKMICLGILAGMFIALGASTSNTAVHGISDVGLARTLAGAIFPVGLMMIVFVGGELFTGNCMIVMAVMDKRVKVSAMIRNLVVVFLSNFVGSMIVVLIINFCGNLDYSAGGLGAYTIKVALAKATMDPVKAVLSGIFCNVLVCIAILMATACKEAAGKIFAIWFPIFAFVIGGFEHVVANMYYIPAGIVASMNPTYVAKAEELYGITSAQLDSLNVTGMLSNFIPVTIGSILGGMVFVGCLVYYVNVKADK